MRRRERLEIGNKGRRIVVPEAADDVARFSFADLCARPLGAGDYLKIAEAFHTIIIDDVPVLGSARRNEAKRFINLIDMLYDKRVRLIVSAEARAATSCGKDADGAEASSSPAPHRDSTEMRSDAYWDAASAIAETKKARAI